MKTAVKEIQEAFEEKDIDGFYIWYHDNKQRLLEKEKQQIVEAVKYGFNDSTKPQCCQDLSFEQYYNETFKNEIDL